VSALERYLSPRDFAARLREAGLPVTEDRTRAWIREGKIPAICLPGDRRHFIAETVVQDILGGKFTSDPDKA